MRHLSDTEIQEYLDGSRAGDARVESHLKSCPACREHYRYYQRLFGELEQDVPFELSATFGHRVVSKIETSRAKDVKTRLVTVASTLVGAAVGIGAVLYFVGWETLILTVRGMGQYFDFPWLAWLRSALADANLHAPLLGLGLLALLIVWLIDQWVFRSKGSNAAPTVFHLLQ